ncbi:MAG: hypothetical protein AAB869_04120 [Patescibacteria group bacterium]
MFILCRVVNSILVAITVLGIIIASAYGGLSAYGFIVAAVLPILLASDFISRKRNSSNNTIFAGCWTLWYLCGVALVVVPRWYVVSGITEIWQKEAHLLLVLVALDAVVYVAPLLINGIYLLCLMTRKRVAIEKP